MKNKHVKLEIMKVQDLLKKEVFSLQSPLETIKVVSVATNVWHTFSNPGGRIIEYDDNELKGLLEKLTKEHFVLRFPKLNY